MKYFLSSITVTLLIFNLSYSYFKGDIRDIWKKIHSNSNKVAKSAILFIGDGMGYAHVTATRIWKKGSNRKLIMEDLPVTGINRTYSSSDFVTDSAASATAMATGVKSYASSINMTDKYFDPSGKSRKLQTIVDLALAAGKSIGIITNAKMPDATPAAFFGHAENRGMKEELAAQIIDSKVTLLMGGGRKYFFPMTWTDPQNGEAGERTDGRNVIKELRAKGWRYIQTKKELRNFRYSKKNKRIIALFNHSSMDFVLNRDEAETTQPKLSEMVSFAIKYLSRNPRGYFLMVESAFIDYAAHANLAKHTFAEVLALDSAVKVAMDQIDERTLMVVTSDHETGGLALNGYGPISIKGDAFLKNVWGGDVYQSFTDPIKKKKCQETITARDLCGEDEECRKPFEEIIWELKCHYRGVISWGSGPGEKSQILAKPTNDFQYKAAYYSSAAAHTAVDVPVLAGGPGQYLFTGFMNNSDIAKKIAKAMGLEFTSLVNLENFDVVENHRF